MRKVLIWLVIRFMSDKYPLMGNPRYPRKHKDRLYPMLEGTIERVL